MITRAVEPRRPQRPREMQDPLNLYLYHPLSWQLARRLAHTPVTPNMVSVAGGLFVVAAGFCYWGVPWPLGAALGMALHMTWHIVDGADGDLRGRRQGRGADADGGGDRSGRDRGSPQAVLAAATARGS